ncbi:uncharacterized protein LOC107365445 [Tetranychus urticae]|nr:uncharacterized protein LOC107365445 [Tetranychus urticae]
MERQNDNSDKITFRVEFLGEYHEVVIDWNDDKYKHKGRQLFDQLESIVGVPREFNYEILLQYHHVVDGANTSPGDPFYHNIDDTDDSNYPNKEEICDSIRDAEGRFRLGYDAHYWFKRTHICFFLVRESSVPEGECFYDFCRYKNTKSFYNKVKDIINNDKLNAKIASAIQPIRDYREKREILRQFDVLKYFRSICDDLYTRRYVNEQFRYMFCERNLYLRTHG